MKTARLLSLALVTMAPLIVGADTPPDDEIPEDVARVLMMGPFEGHGFRPPKDKKRVRQARVVAQRLARTCWDLVEQRGGGAREYSRACNVPKVESEHLFAIFDALNDATLRTSAIGLGQNDMRAPLTAIARIGGPKATGALVTALERLALRAQYADYFTQPLRDDDRFDEVAHALERATLLSVAPVEGEGTERERIAAGWRAWMSAHAGDDETTWREGLAARARELADSDDLDQRARGIAALWRWPKTKAEAKRLRRKFLRAHPKAKWRLDRAMAD